MDAKAREAIFRAEGLTKVYRMGEVEVHALRGVDLVLYAGEFVVLLGPSGSGKSTLLNLLGGLDVPTAGQVWYHGEDLTRASDAQLTQFRREHVGFVFQFYNLIPSLTARENVAIVTEIAPHPMPPEQALAMVGLTERLDHFPAQLSGGEQQRVAIARAIAKRPVVMLCDEPTGALDSATGVRVLEALERVNAATTAEAVAQGELRRMQQLRAQGMVTASQLDQARTQAETASVTRIEPGGFTKVSALGVEEQRTRAILDFTSSHARWAALGDAYRVEVEFLLRQDQDVLQVPGSALFCAGDGWAVYALDGGTARRTVVKVGARSALAAQVLDGLQAGQSVIVQPEDRIQDGTRIEAAGTR